MVVNARSDSTIPSISPDDRSTTAIECADDDRSAIFEATNPLSLGGRLLPRESGFVASKIALRSSSAHSIAVVERSSGEMLGMVESERAFTTIHPGAIYL